ncbi:MAG: hypothetical protein M3R48_09220 [Candidatus Dormibacteraeota bacterium]|nr:hypothetical protein [Candidatus Dormibacteraeota bacterium]
MTEEAPAPSQRNGGAARQSRDMEMSFAFFADAATVPADGKVYVLGGGFSALALAQLPGMAGFAVVAGFRFTAADAGRAHVIEMRFVDNLGKLVLPPTSMRFESSGPPPDGVGEVSVTTVTRLQPTFGEPGDYAAEFWHEGTLLMVVRLAVMEQSPGGATGGGPPLA